MWTAPGQAAPGAEKDPVGEGARQEPGLPRRDTSKILLNPGVNDSRLLNKSGLRLCFDFDFKMMIIMELNHDNDEIDKI